MLKGENFIQTALVNCWITPKIEIAEFLSDVIRGCAVALRLHCTDLMHFSAM